jgi:hypothetical protein
MGGVSGWAAKATAQLSAYAPFTWVIGALLGSLLFLSGYWLLSKAKEGLMRAELTQRSLALADLVNPLDSTFTNRKIDLSVFKRPLPAMADGKVFVSCEIHCATNLISLGINNIHGCNFLGCDFVVVRENAFIVNAIPLLNSTFNNCLVYGTTFLVPEGAVKNFPAGPNWITPVPLAT